MQISHARDFRRPICSLIGWTPKFVNKKKKMKMKIRKMLNGRQRMKGKRRRKHQILRKYTLHPNPNMENYEQRNEY